MTIPAIPSSSQAIGNSLSGLANSTNRLLSDVGAGLGNTPSNWREMLRPGSFRGVPFGVFESQLQFGRKVSVHEYPFRNTVWVEDLGRSARRISFAGFLVGDDCIAQRDKLIKACEEAAAAEGSELVHPSLGRLKVSLAGEVTSIERWDRGRVFEIGFAFIEQGERQFPSTQQSTGDAVDGAVSAATAAVEQSFLQAVAGTLRTGLTAAQQAASFAQGWANAGQRLINDATSLVNYVQSLQGNFGRLFGQGTVRSSSTATSVQGLIAQGALARTSVQGAVARMSSAGAGLAAVSGPTVADASASAALQAFADTVLALPSVMASVAPTPADGIRLVGSLRAAAPAPSTGGANVPAATPGAALTASMATAALSTASSALLRRGCAIAQAQLSSQYQPISRDDAQAVLNFVLASIDAEIAAAGDMGEDSAYNSLRTLRTAVAQDLSSRAASAAALATVTMNAPLPAPVLAQRLYRDATRADELVQEAAPIHPAFMPRVFQALAR